jgi:hypothetical protein
MIQLQLYTHLSFTTGDGAAAQPGQCRLYRLLGRIPVQVVAVFVVQVDANEKVGLTLPWQQSIDSSAVAGTHW